ncbi:MAG TPA: sugar transferase [Acidimicrobiales bacterium]|nr:sugar transferase [Acidimicrobiales bacterium]
MQTLERTATDLGHTGFVDVELDGIELHHLLEGLNDWHQWTLPRRVAKRALDVAVSLTMLLVLLPVLVLTALAIKFDSPGPVFYRQRRCGKDNLCFGIFKFRSMRTDADELLAGLQSQNESDGLLFKMKNDPRITRVGTFIRRYSIDELPQLLNVLKGDMSLVGPRPLPIKPEDFDVLDGCRHAVRPGLTCHWQVSGRSELSYKQMVALDLAYIRESTIWTDIHLLVRTVPVVLAGSGAY